MSGGVVAIVGRPNVGKSTLFNRLVGERQAIIEAQPGTTRDRLYGASEWSGRSFTLIDTGGLDLGSGEPMLARVRAQALVALDEADVVVFLVEATAGVTPADAEVAQLLRRSQKPVILGVNKGDSAARRLAASEFYALGLGDPVPLSAIHGTGTGDLLDAIVAHLPVVEPEPEFEGLRLAIVGRPNVGKSSLVNRILGEERTIVSELPGTTRDAIDVPFRYHDQDLLLIDTAGLRRRGRIAPGVERYGSLRAARAIARCDVAVVLVDVQEGVTAQDTHVAGYVLEEEKGLVLALNKWDLAKGQGEDYRRQAERHLEESFNFAPWAPQLFISALAGRGVPQLLDTVLEVHDNRRQRVGTSELNRWLREVVARHQPPHKGGQPLRLYYATQSGVSPPTFVFFVNRPQMVHWSYQRYLENELRAAFGFRGTPLRLHFRPRREEK